MLRALFLVLLLLTAITNLRAQGLSSKGKEFWVTFMTNLGGGGAETARLRIYLSCDHPTNATITYTLTGASRQIPIPTANTTVQVDINALFGNNVELDDLDPFGGANNNEIVSKSLLVTAVDDITLYGVNIRAKSADAFLGLPRNVLTGRYIVLAYPNGYSEPGFGQQGGFDTPSEFAVVATEDGTNVTISPSPGLQLNSRGNKPFSVMLNRGQIFYGQADILQVAQDVSGTEVRADKPVALFSGNKRTSIPTRVANYRDHLVEQLPPLDGWGRDAMLTPHFKVTPQSTDTAVARILAAFPGTEVTIVKASGTTTYQLGPGISIEIPLLEPMTVTGSQPIMAAQYEHSVNVANGSLNAIGDPFMMLVVPRQQFDTAYAFQSIVDNEFVVHYINVVVPKSGETSLKLDAAPVNAKFLPIPGSTYLYTQLEVSPGSHYIACDSAFGLYVYGFGPATSYGYPGGMLFHKLVSDFDPPGLEWKEDCGQIEGYAFDSHISDTGIDSCYATSASRNVVLNIEPFIPGADTVRYTAKLVDPYQDGAAVIRAIDSAGHTITQSRPIPGFTLRVGAAAPATLDTFVSINARTFCRTVTIHNYGSFPQNLDRVALLDSTSHGAITATLPVIIPPGGDAQLQICFTDLADTSFTTGLTIGGDCADRMVALLPVVNVIDTTGPGIGREGIGCGDDFTISYSKRFRTSGIASFSNDTAINCTVTPITDPASLPANLVQFKLHRNDPRLDMIYQVTISDGSGNSVVDRDTIGGFTLAMLDSARDTIGVRVDKGWFSDSLALTEVRPDSITLVNYGIRPLTLASAFMKSNVRYSIPPLQLPLVIPAHSSVGLRVNVQGADVGDQIDTLVLVDLCGHNEELAMLTPVIASVSNAAVCNTRISVSTFAPVKRTFLTALAPNPSNTGAYVDVGLTHQQPVSLAIYDANGNRVMDLLQNIELNAGISRITFDVSGLGNGAYFCRMTTSGGESRVEKMIVNR
ncbi:MAG: hypothetical protein JWQ98_1149 [Chlorobi bacterium]|nr:hypothetical protein [Chlorobiota bacterium]